MSSIPPPKPSTPATTDVRNDANPKIYSMGMFAVLKRYCCERGDNSCGNHPILVGLTVKRLTSNLKYVKV
jgi:hypothetical protein